MKLVISREETPPRQVLLWWNHVELVGRSQIVPGSRSHGSVCCVESKGCHWLPVCVQTKEAEESGKESVTFWKQQEG